MKEYVKPEVLTVLLTTEEDMTGAVVGSQGTGISPFNLDGEIIEG